jgi:peptidoglycan/xylan/chitin deacetylase (PgdA/CDA1 family)
MDRRRALGVAAAAIGLALAGCDAETRVPASGGKPSSGGNTAGSASPPPTTRGRATLPAEVTHGPLDRTNVALTFHGQGDPKLADRLLTELEKGGARVTVLAVGSWLQAEPAMARRILDGGHELGNHTQNHGPIAQMTSPAAFAEVDACAQILKKLTGSVGTWFRPSQTVHATETIRAEAAKLGYPTVLSYDLDSLDYTDPGETSVVRNILSAVTNGSVVSMHFGHTGTVAAVPAVLDGLRQKGLRAVTMTELMSA